MTRLQSLNHQRILCTAEAESHPGRNQIWSSLIAASIPGDSSIDESPDTEDQTFLSPTKAGGLNVEGSGGIPLLPLLPILPLRQTYLEGRILLLMTVLHGVATSFCCPAVAFVEKCVYSHGSRRRSTKRPSQCPTLT